MDHGTLEPARRFIVCVACLSATAVACSRSPTAPTVAAAAVGASHAVVHAGDTVTFVLTGHTPDQRVFWQFTTSDFTPIAFEPLVASEPGAPQTPTETHRTTIRIVRIPQPTRLTAEAWSVPGFGDNPPARLIAAAGVDAVP
jgi:hypothetical protein